MPDIKGLPHRRLVPAGSAAASAAGAAVATVAETVAEAVPETAFAVGLVGASAASASALAEPAPAAYIAAVVIHIAAEHAAGTLKTAGYARTRQRSSDNWNPAFDFLP